MAARRRPPPALVLRRRTQEMLFKAPVAVRGRHTLWAAQGATGAFQRRQRGGQRPLAGPPEAAAASRVNTMAGVVEGGLTAAEAAVQRLALEEGGARRMSMARQPCTGVCLRLPAVGRSLLPELRGV